MNGRQVPTAIASFLPAEQCSRQGNPQPTDENLMTYLRPRGVTHMHRRKQDPNTDNAQRTPRRQVVIQFRPSIERPHELSFGWFKRRVLHFPQVPPMCYSFHRFGHLSKKCRVSGMTCVLCSGPEHWHDCPEGTPLQCANCKESHAVCNPQCPTRLIG